MDIREELTKEILKYNPGFSKESLDAGLEYFEFREFNAKDIILKEGRVCQYIFFAQRAVSRCYLFDESGEEKTVWLEPEKMFITDFESFIKGTPSHYYLQFYEETQAGLITRQNLLFLYENYKDWAVFGIKLMENYHIRILELFTIMFSNNATENYEFIEKHFSKFLQVVPLKDIASMLNLSPVSLSRIRAGTQTKK